MSRSNGPDRIYSILLPGFVAGFVIFAAQHMQEDLKGIYGNIDIYLFDQLLKGTYSGCASVLDAGCGTGRNLAYFLKQEIDVYGVDINPGAILHCRALAAGRYGSVVEEHFQVSAVENLPFDDQKFDLVISSAVLHFAKNPDHFESMLSSMWRVLRPGGYLFCRLASDIGIETVVKFIGNGRYVLLDESERFLVNQEMLIRLTKKLGGALHEPIKTTNVQNLRCMTTWCIKK